MAGTLACPSCGASFAYTTRFPMRADDFHSSFSLRGHDGRTVVLECVACTRWMTWRAKFLGGPRVEPISPDREAVMRAHRREVMTGDPFGATDAQRDRLSRIKREDRQAAALQAGKVPCPDCGRFFGSDRALSDHRAAAHSA